MLFGYNRHGKKGHEQVVIGLLCPAQGCPVGCEVFAGNVERAFRSLKMSHLEIGPVYHKRDDRIRAHVFMCMLGAPTKRQIHDFMKLLARKNHSKGHERCPSGSARKLRDCHREFMKELRGMPRT